MRIGRALAAGLLLVSATSCTVPGSATIRAVTLLDQDDVLAAVDVVFNEAWSRTVDSDGTWHSGKDPISADDRYAEILTIWEEQGGEPEQCREYYLESQLVRESDRSAPHGEVTQTGSWVDGNVEDPAYFSVTTRVDDLPFSGPVWIGGVVTAQQTCGATYSLGTDYRVVDLGPGPAAEGVAATVQVTRNREVTDDGTVFVSTLLARDNVAVLVESSTPEDRVAMQAEADALVVELAGVLAEL